MLHFSKFQNYLASLRSALLVTSQILLKFTLINMCRSTTCTCVFIQYFSMIMHNYLGHKPNFMINKV